MLGHIVGLFYDPQTEWKKLAALPEDSLKKLTIFFIFMGMIPSIGFYIGVTEVGWSLADGEKIRITKESALPLVVLLYFAMMGALIFIGGMARWMSKTYNAELTLYQGFLFMGLCCTPVFLGGIFAVYPIWWLDLLIAIVACSYAIRLVYLGIPDVMRVPEDQGFLYASAVFAMALVYVVGVLVATIILWDIVGQPVFTN